MLLFVIDGDVDVGASKLDWGILSSVFIVDTGVNCSYVLEVMAPWLGKFCEC